MTRNGKKAALRSRWQRVTSAVALLALPAQLWAAQAFQESGGQVTLEAEHRSANIARSGATWALESLTPGYSGTGYLKALPNAGTSYATGYGPSSPELQYLVNFTTTGIYYVWIRGQGISTNDDMLHAGYDGNATILAKTITSSAFLNTFGWNNKRNTGSKAYVDISTPGIHLVQLWMGEDGFMVDKIWLTTNITATAPSGVGPAESPQLTISDTTPPPVPGQPIEWNWSIASDADYISSGSYSVSWPAGSGDPESRITAAEVQERVGSTGTWTTLTSTATTGSVPISGRAHNTTYYYRVRTQNGAGLWSTWSATSDGIKIDTTAPSVATVTDDGNYTNALDRLHAVWSSGSDSESGIMEYQYLIRQDSTTGTIIVPQTSAALATLVTRTGLTLVNGTFYYIGVVARNGAGTFSTMQYSNGIRVDTTAPTVTISSPGNGATVSGTITVNATVIENNSMGSVQFKLDGANLGAPDGTSPYSASWNTTTVADGSHVLTAVATDSAGNIGPASAPVTVTVSNGGDTVPPTGSVTINSGAAATNTTAATLTLSATDAGGSVTQMQFSNDGTTYSTAETYATSKTWTLATGDGTKTVYAKFKDAAGNWSTAVSDTITLDAAAPTISSQNAASLTTSGATITWTTNEASTTQVDYGTTTSYGQSTTLDSSLLTSHSAGITGLSAGTLYHYRARSRDAVGNERLGTDSTFTTLQPADTTAPTGSISINSGASATNTRTVTLTLTATDNSGSVAQMRFSDNGSTYSTAEAYATTKSWMLPTSDGPKTVYVQFKDAAGNWSAAATDSIVLDTTPPSLSFTSPLDGAVLIAP